MFVCPKHSPQVATSARVDYIIFSCGGSERGCGSFAHPADGGGPPGACPDCGREWKVTDTMQIELNYCPECLPYGFPEAAKPSYIPVTVVGGFVAIKPPKK